MPLQVAWALPGTHFRCLTAIASSTSRVSHPLLACVGICLHLRRVIFISSPGYLSLTVPTGTEVNVIRVPVPELWNT